MWYVVWTVTGKEESARTEIGKMLPQESYSRCFIPKRKESRKRGTERIKVDRILFPGYLFIETDDAETVFFYLKKLPQYAKLLRAGEDFIPVAPEEEAWLRKLMKNGETVEISVGMIANQTIRVTEGPLRGMEGFIRRVDRHKRKAWLRLEMFGRTLDVCMGLEIVEKK